ELGVDVELARPDFPGEEIAVRFFSRAEVAALRGLPWRLRAEAFLTCWTRKEAFIKAKGEGLSLPLDSFDVTLVPGAPAALLRTGWAKHEAGEWALADLSDPERGYVAAVALRERGLRVVRTEVDDRILEESAMGRETR